MTDIELMALCLIANTILLPVAVWFGIQIGRERER